MPNNSYAPFATRADREEKVTVHARIVGVGDGEPVDLTDEYLAMMRRKIDAQKRPGFKLTATSPAGW